MVMAAWMRPTCVYACGKLPSSCPVAGSMSSENSPSGFAKRLTRWKTATASSSRPARASASAHQNEQIVNALVVAPKSSSLA